MSATIRILGPDDASLLDNVAEGVFDHLVDPGLAVEFVSDPRHHMAVAIDGGVVVGMASALHYVHPDKRTELWVNEVAVAPTHRVQGIGRRMLEALFARARALGCGQAWVATEPSNTAARRLYAAVGGMEAAEPFVMVEFSLDAPSAAGGTATDEPR